MAEAFLPTGVSARGATPACLRDYMAKYPGMRYSDKMVISDIKAIQQSLAQGQNSSLFDSGAFVVEAKLAVIRALEAIVLRVSTQRGPEKSRKAPKQGQ